MSKLEDIRFRVDPIEKERWNDKRHEQRLDWQGLGMALLRAWYDAYPGARFADTFSEHLFALNKKARIGISTGTSDRDDKKTGEELRYESTGVLGERADTNKPETNGILDVQQQTVTGWHGVLKRILDSGYEPAITAITHNLYAFQLLVDSEGRTGDYPIPSYEQFLTDTFQRLGATERNEGTTDAEDGDRGRKGGAPFPGAKRAG